MSASDNLSMPQFGSLPVERQSVFNSGTAGGYDGFRSPGSAQPLSDTPGDPSSLGSLYATPDRTFNISAPSEPTPMPKVGATPGDGETSPTVAKPTVVKPAPKKPMPTINPDASGHAATARNLLRPGG